MNVLDENILADQRQLLRSWRIRVRQIGPDLAYKGVKDDGIIPFLHRLDRPTFFTRDAGFYDRRFCHGAYCLVFLNVDKSEAANFVRRTLRYAALDTWAKRVGKVIRVGHSRLLLWNLRTREELTLTWDR